MSVPTTDSCNWNTKTLWQNLNLNVDIGLVHKDSCKSKKQKQQPEALTTSSFQLETPCT